MLRLIARLVSVCAGTAAGYFVHAEMSAVFEQRTALIAGGSVALLVYAILYFPLFRPVADMLSDRLSVAVHRGRHIRSGSGLDALPDAPVPVRCSICGKDGGPICADCGAEMERADRKRNFFE